MARQLRAWRLAPSSLRGSVLLVAVALALGPTTLVLAASSIELLAGDRTLERSHRTAAQIAAFLSERGPAGLDDAEGLRRSAEPLLAQHRLRARLLLPSGAVRLVDDELATTSPLILVGDFFYGWARRSALQALDTQGPVLSQRKLVARALETGRAGDCWHEVQGNLRICEADERVELAGIGPVVVDVEGSSRQAFQALWDARRQLLKLTLASLTAAVLLALWLGQRFVRPISSLREQLLARAQAAVPRAGLDVPGRGEIGDLTASFNSLLTALAERSRQTEEFLADLTHELKNPIAGIRAAVEQLQTPGLSPERLARLTEVIGSSAGRLDGVVSQFLELAKAEGGLPNEPREEVDLQALLSQLVAGLKADPRRAGVQLSFDSDGSPLPVPGVAWRLESAFRNLLDNGASFAGAGGTVRARLAREDAMALVEIADSGPGIPPESLPRLFERFFTTRGDQTGTGLGLALTRAVVEAHGGTIAVTSPSGKGATFLVRLPVTEVSPPNR